MSVYQGDELTSEGIATNIKTLQSAFPDLDEHFHDVFAGRIKDLGIGDKRLKDSINHVIDNCVYPKPTIAQFISYDKKVKLYNYQQMVNLNNELNGKAFEYYKRVNILNVTQSMYASIQDIEMYNLELVK